MHFIATGETLYSLAFGMKVMIPVEIGMSSYRVKHFQQEQNEEQLNLNLNLLEDKREHVQFRVAAHKRKVARYFNSKVSPRSFRVEEWFLKKVF